MMNFKYTTLRQRKLFQLFEKNVDLKDLLRLHAPFAVLIGQQETIIKSSKCVKVLPAFSLCLHDSLWKTGAYPTPRRLCYRYGAPIKVADKSGVFKVHSTVKEQVCRVFSTSLSKEGSLRTTVKVLISGQVKPVQYSEEDVPGTTPNGQTLLEGFAYPFLKNQQSLYQVATKKGFKSHGPEDP